jgi:hypothetical protein
MSHRADAAAEAEKPAEWLPMSSAPTTRPILLRTTWARRPLAVVGEWLPVHGAYCSQGVFGHDPQVIHMPTGWCEIPDLGGAV